MSKKLVMHSGGMDSTAIMLDYIDVHGPDNIISIGYDYGQRHFQRENGAATRFCEKHGVKRVVLDVPISQIGGCSLIDHDIPVTTDMADQRSTVVPQRNAIFCLFAAAFAQENDCDTIVHGACIEDYEAYRDCRPVFFELLEQAIQAGRTNPIKGAENIKENMIGDIGIVSSDALDLRIETPLINEKKEETVKRILEKYDVSVYEDSYTCYNGVEPSCGKCPACVERLQAFKVNNVTDPLSYA
jgi:7-cyano-7-deazaguanine synthase